ncbi:vasoactive intestinal polypeptide receptor-like protein, partial [Dinothrombium tinctorium]
GFFVALLYCFLNNEVQQELKKLWQRWRSQSNGHQPSNSTTYHSFITQSLTYLSKGRSSILSTTDPLRKESSNKMPNISPCKKESTFLAPALQIENDTENYADVKIERANGSKTVMDIAGGSMESVL